MSMREIMAMPRIPIQPPWHAEYAETRDENGKKSDVSLMRFRGQEFLVYTRELPRATPRKADLPPCAHTMPGEQGPPFVCSKVFGHFGARHRAIVFDRESNDQTLERFLVVAEWQS